MPKPQTHEELLIENAILKNNDQVRKMLKEELAPFSRTIKELDSRLSVVEEEMKAVKETIEPLTNIRRRAWAYLIAASLAVGVGGQKATEWIAKALER